MEDKSTDVTKVKKIFRNVSQFPTNFFNGQH